MVFVSVTRVRPRSLRCLLIVVLHSWRSRSQLRGTMGFIGRYLASGPRFGMWTVTVWDDEQSMREWIAQTQITIRAVLQRLKHFHG